MEYLLNKYICIKNELQVTAAHFFCFITGCVVYTYTFYNFWNSV